MNIKKGTTYAVPSVSHRPMKHSNTKQTATGWNGWTNFETWCAYHCLSNNEGSYHTMRQLAKSHNNPDKAAEAIRDYIAEKNPLETGEIIINAMMYAQMCQALKSINWREIAEAFQEE